MTDSGKLAVLDHVHSKGSVSASWPGAEGATESGGSDWDIDDQFGYGASRSDSQTGASNSDYLSVFPDVRSVVTYFAQTTGVFHRGDIALPASELLLVNIPGGTVVYATTHRYDWESLNWNNGVPQSTNTTHVYAIMKWGDGDAWYTDLKSQIAQFAPITRLPTTGPQANWSGLASDIVFNFYIQRTAINIVVNSYNDITLNGIWEFNFNQIALDTFVADDDPGKQLAKELLVDATIGGMDRLLDTINPINNIISIPDIGPMYGHTTAYAIGGAVGTVAGIGLSVAAGSVMSGLFACGTLGQAVVVSFKVVSIANDLKGAHDSYEKGDAAGFALNLLSAALNVKDLRKALSACFAKGTKLWWEHGYKAIEEFQPGERVWSRDENDPNGKLVLKPIEAVFERLGQILRLTVGGKEILTTPEHPFYEKTRGWVAAKDLSIGDELATDADEWVPVGGVSFTEEVTTVYNLRVGDFHTYFVEDANWGFGVWAHNASCNPGKLANVAEDFSDIASKYQKQITGNAKGRAYIVDGLKFDGFKKGTLLEAKGLGYATLMNNPSIAFGLADNLISQAKRQLKKANGVPIIWHVAEEEFSNGLKYLFRNNKIDITVIFTPIIH